MSLNEGYIEKMSFLLNFSGIAFDVEIEIKNIDETIVGTELCLKTFKKFFLLTL